MDKSAKIYVAGHHGLVGSAIWNNLKERGYNNLVGRSHKELDLLDPMAVKKFFDEEQPDAVILAAAHVYLFVVLYNSLLSIDYIFDYTMLLNILMIALQIHFRVQALARTPSCL